MSADPTPVVYVDPAAPAGGDGSEGNPFSDLDDALRSTAATVAVAAGRYVASRPLTVARDVVVVGMGSAVTEFVWAEGSDGLAVSAGAAVQIRDVGLVGSAGPCETDATAALRADGATLRISNVHVESAGNGVWVTGEGAALDASAVTFTGIACRAVVVSSGAHARIEDFSVADGAGQGFLVQGGRLHLSRGQLRELGSYGITYQGDAPDSGGASDCETLPQLDATGPLDCIRDVVVSRSMFAGLYVIGPEGGVRRIDAGRLQVDETRVAPMTAGGDGIYLDGRIEFALDEGVTTMATPEFGSSVIRNARSGIVVSGGARAAIGGTLIGSNYGAGLFTQQGSSLAALRASLVEDNGALGVGITPSSHVGALEGNRFLGTRYTTLASRAGGALPYADGLSIGAAGGADTIVRGNEISDNARFGVLLFDVSAGDFGANLGAGNGVGVGIYGSSLTPSDLGDIGGREAAPSTAPQGASDDSIAAVIGMWE